MIPTMPQLAPPSAEPAGGASSPRTSGVGERSGPRSRSHSSSSAADRSERFDAALRDATSAADRPDATRDDVEAVDDRAPARSDDDATASTDDGRDPADAGRDDAAALDRGEADDGGDEAEVDAIDGDVDGGTVEGETGPVLTSASDPAAITVVDAESAGPDGPQPELATFDLTTESLADGAEEAVSGDVAADDSAPVIDLGAVGGRVNPTARDSAASDLAPGADPASSATTSPAGAVGAAPTTRSAGNGGDQQTSRDQPAPDAEVQMSDAAAAKAGTRAVGAAASGDVVTGGRVEAASATEAATATTATPTTVDGADASDGPAPTEAPTPAPTNGPAPATTSTATATAVGGPAAVDGAPAPATSTTNTAAPQGADAAADPSVDAGDPAWRQVGRALGSLRTTGNGEQQMTVKLHPAELGGVTIRVTSGEGGTFVGIVADSTVGMARLQHQAPHLLNELRAGGLTDVSVDVRSEDSNGSRGSAGDPRGDRPAPDASLLGQDRQDSFTPSTEEAAQALRIGGGAEPSLADLERGYRLAPVGRDASRLVDLDL